MGTPRVHWAAGRHQVGLVHGFRSGLEERNAKLLEDLGEPVNYETLVVPYLIPGAIHRYHPDFRLANGILIELKGLFLPVDRAKHLFCKAQFPELDLRMVFTRAATPLRKGGKETYGDWCVKHGIQYAEKLIPLEWIREAGPKLAPEAVIKGGGIEPCLEWGGPRLPKGYGTLRVEEGKKVYIHRAVWENAHGPIPEGLVVMHICDNPPCYRLSHLKLGTYSDNTQDMLTKGRAGVQGVKHPNAKLTEAQVRSIRADTRSQQRIASEYGLSQARVSVIKVGKAWKHLK